MRITAVHVWSLFKQLNIILNLVLQPVVGKPVNWNKFLKEFAKLRSLKKQQQSITKKLSSFSFVCHNIEKNWSEEIVIFNQISNCARILK